MAADNTIEVTAWGKCGITMGPTGASDAIATTLTDIGYVKEDTAKLTVNKGDVKEIYGEGHELLDSKELNGYWVLTATLTKMSLSQMAKLYGRSIDDATGVLKLGKTTVTEVRSYVVTPELSGAIMAQMPKCKTFITPVLQTAEGWTVDIEVRTLVPLTGVDDACQLSKKA